MNENITGKRINELLREKGMTQRELAEKAMTTEVSMSRFVKGDRVPKGPILANIAKTLGVTTDYLVGKSDKTEGWTGNWIPCEKEMPAENEDVLLSGIRRSADVGYYDGDAEAFFCYISGDLQYPVAEVKVWMPLPEPYKENENVEER